MKRFFLVSLLLITIIETASACGWDGYRHNNYMFSIFRRELMNNIFEERTNLFWKEYSNGKYSNYEWYPDNIREIAQNKHDGEMLAYLTHLEKYLGICNDLKDTWEYPSAQQLALRKKNLQNMIVAAKNYRGTRLKGQYQLLLMRANMVLGQHLANKTFWEQNEKNIKPSVYRDMMLNIYAGALLHLGQRERACDIFAEQGDMTSIRWTVRKHRNLAGIMSFYNENPNSNVLIYLVQDFVNNAQETLDNGQDDSEWLEMLGAKLIIKSEVYSFINFANKVVSEKKTHSPAMWKAAAGTLLYLYGDAETAEKYLAEAMTMDGTQRMKDNARAIHIIAKAQAAEKTTDWSAWMTGELDWLDSKMREERGQGEFFENHYSDIKDRLTHQIIYKRYCKEGKKETALAALSMMNEDIQEFNPGNLRSPRYKEEYGGWNPDYDTEYVWHLDSLSANELTKYFDYLKRQHNDPLEQYFVSRAYVSDDYFNDRIGTRLIAEGRLAEALPYLKKVSLKFLSSQNIAPYMEQRDYTKEKWLENQRDGLIEEGASLTSVSRNVKAEYCENVLQLESRYAIANNESKSEIAYELAKLYYQASYMGDCWWLTHYGWSIGDTVRTGEKDFVSTAISYLEMAKRSTNINLKQRTLYALAFIPLDEWAEVSYDWQTDEFIYTPRRQSRQYKALCELTDFARTNSGRLPQYISHCDVLKQFIR